MKKALLFIFAFYFLTFNKEIFAQNIQTGKASAKSEVHTKIQGNGNIETNIEVWANGEKKELKATGAGDYKLELSSSPTPVRVNKSPVNVRSPLITRIENLRKEIFKIFRDWFGGWFEPLDK